MIPAEVTRRNIAMVLERSRDNQWLTTYEEMADKVYDQFVKPLEDKLIAIRQEVDRPPKQGR